jgi:hypothetical protein
MVVISASKGIESTDSKGYFSEHGALALVVSGEWNRRGNL